MKRTYQPNNRRRARKHGFRARMSTPRGPRGAEVPSRQGPHPSVGLIDRIRERDAFLRLRRDGVRVRIDPLWCSFVPDSEVVPPQVAFAIGRATGSAVQRNRLRRRLRALLHDCDVPPGLLLIGATSRANEHTFDELGQCLTESDTQGHSSIDHAGMTWMQRRALSMIEAYQRAFAGRPSPCRFYPTCSAYAHEAYEVHGTAADRG